MAQAPKFTVRPLPSRLARNDNKDAFRVLLSGSALVGLKLTPGDPCNLQAEDGRSRTALAWNAVERIQDSIVQTSTILQQLYQLKLGDKISISKFEGILPEAETVALEEVESSDQDKFLSHKPLAETDRPHWEWFLQWHLQRAALLSSRMLFENVNLKSEKRSFIIREIEPTTPAASSSLFLFTHVSRVRLVDNDHRHKDAASKPSSFHFDSTGIGGLDEQIRKLRGILEKYHCDSSIPLPSFYRPNRGILLYGPKGTGKSLLAGQVSRVPWGKVLKLSHSNLQSTEGNTAMVKTFSEALQYQPSLIMIDDIASIAGKPNAIDFQSGDTLLSSLRRGFDMIKDARVLVIAESRHPNDVNETLRGLGSFSVEIEIPVPTAHQRYDILRAIRGESEEPAENLLRDFSERTHGYVGADLYSLLQCAVELAEERCHSGQRQVKGMAGGVEGKPLDRNQAEPDVLERTTSRAPSLHITPDDMSSALSSTRPSAMQEIFIETPNIRWSDIGGQDTSKRLLQSAVSRPLHQAPAMRRLGLNPKKGVLLYGPPGCSKTLLVKALAAESSLNFLAVKGAEIVSMYVGESERNVREIFRKARAASPSIVFFDEIDSIAGDRSSSSSGVGSMNLLTTFLNEMDGFEELKNVLVVAATNRPESLDRALLRPGRFDNLIYIGLPSREARQEILEIFFRTSSIAEDVDAIALADMTEGYSGAEIVAICQTAGELAIDATIDQKLSLDLVTISPSHFFEAIHLTPKGTSLETEKAFKDWRRALR